jgi:hypothetical protein
VPAMTVEMNLQTYLELPFSVILSPYLFFDAFLFFLIFSPASSKDQPDESEKDTLPT